MAAEIPYKLGQQLFLVLPQDAQLKIKGASILMATLRGVAWNPSSKLYTYKAFLVEDEEICWLTTNNFNPKILNQPVYAFATYAQADSFFKALVDAG